MRKNFVRFIWCVLLRFALLGGIAAFLSLSNSAYCFQPNPTVACEFSNSNAVFVGTVISTRDEPGRGPADNDGWIYTLTVQKIFRGPSSKTIEVYTENANTRFPFDMGKQYLLFAWKYRGQLVITNCGNSAAASDAIDSIRKLEKMKISDDAVIEGRIWLSDDKDPSDHVTGIVVVILGASGTFKAPSDSDGLFRVHVPPGTYSARVRQSSGRVITAYGSSGEDPDHFVARKGHCSGLQFRVDARK
jgi:hypothetical protein